MKEFWVYSLLRLVLFAAVLVVVLGIWIAVFGGDDSILWPLVVAFAISGIISAFVLNRSRAALAERLEARAHRAAQRFEARRSAEDEPDS